MSASDSTTTPLFKRCRNCGNEYPATAEYFYRKPNGSFRLPCRACQIAIYRQWQKDHPSKVKANNDRYRHNHREKVNERKRRWDQKNSEKRQASQRKYRNSEHGRKVAQRWRDNHREKLRERSRQWYMADPQRKVRRNQYTRRYHQTHGYVSQKRYYHTHPESKAVAKQRRRAREMALPDTFTIQEWRHALNYFNGCCAVCGRPPGLWHTIAADHWIPVTSPACPGTIASNMLPLCHSQKDGFDGCNNTKADKDAIEWLTARYAPRKAKRILARIEAYFASLKEGTP